jgi:PadR family transcriptional regulator PadR
MRHRHRHPRGVRSRRQTRPGHWDVRARVERFVEPSLLLLLRERPLHGYELIESLVSSEWSAELPGPAKRTYELTDEGRRLLDRWAEALRQAQADVQGFLDRYDQDERR